MGARESLESIVASALPGVTLTHSQRPPNKLPVKAGYEYFYLEPRGEFWEGIQAERALGVFLAQEFTSATLEFISVGKSES